jgi:hypothetical protein
MKLMRCTAIVAAIGAAFSVASANVTILGSQRYASVEHYNSQTHVSTYNSADSSLAVGAWTGSVGYAFHHSVVTDSFISVELTTHYDWYPLEYPYYVEQTGFASLITRFEIADVASDVLWLWDNSWFRAQLVRESPDPQTWTFAQQQHTYISDLIPGTYRFSAECEGIAGGRGTLYIPSAGSYLLLAAGLFPLLARPRRSRFWIA